MSISFPSRGPIISPRFSRILRQAASRSENLYKHGCILLKSGKIIATASNGTGFRSHAEFNAIKKVISTIKNSRTPKDYKLVVVRIDRTGNFVNSEPCSECTKLLKRVGIGHVIYSNSFGEFVKKQVDNLKGDHISRGTLILNRNKSESAVRTSEQFFSRFFGRR